MSNNKETNMSITWGKTDLSKDERAMHLAQVALGWSHMTAEEQMDNVKRLVQRAQEIKVTL